ncbi:DUF4132 domain-containing protein [Actinacidiphila acididurans]|uniref:DUF4132 domain-containing protein n=1 Tax=Actinacidiphila acididurans TaxID=2784346 RepID=A0ABS2TVH2_9ACTN|nr:DUF4132 domain-containing protein [Actinacidiphila acididurans]MBM9506956.1 DUF4132 domain-containing protein [Actinacidiphila acididurans]
MLRADFPRPDPEYSAPRYEPLAPLGMNRRLVAAARADEREAPHEPFGPGGDPAVCPAPHSAAVIAALTEEQRRHVVRELQRRREGFLRRDREWWAVKALADVRCGWSPHEAAGLLRSAVSEFGHGQPARWGPDSEHCLHLPLAAVAELAPQDRGPTLPYLRRTLALCTDPHGTEPPAPDRERCARRLTDTLALPFPVDPLLPREDAYAAAVRCHLGPELYHPDVVELLRLCAGADGIRPDYAWLGSVREHLERSSVARDALRPLLLPYQGEEYACRAGRGLHSGVPGPIGGRLLGALAWAACLSGQPGTVDTLATALRRHSRLRSDELPPGSALFFRAGLAALDALAGEPGAGVHQRLLPDPGQALRGLARRQVNRLRQQPANWAPTALRYVIGDYTAQLTVDSDGTVSLGFRNAHGRALTGVPQRVRSRDPLRYAALRTRLTEVRAQVATHLGTLAERRIADPGTPAATWTAAYLDEPALQPLTRALIWQADTPRGPVLGLPVRRRRSTHWMLRDLTGAVHELTDDTPVRLWNPDRADADVVRAWREVLKRQRVRQPVRQIPE